MTAVSLMTPLRSAPLPTPVGNSLGLRLSALKGLAGSPTSHCTLLPVTAWGLTRRKTPLFGSPKKLPRAAYSTRVLSPGLLTRARSVQAAPDLGEGNAVIVVRSRRANGRVRERGLPHLRATNQRHQTREVEPARPIEAPDADTAGRGVRVDREVRASRRRSGWRWSGSTTIRLMAVPMSGLKFDPLLATRFQVRPESVDL